MLFSTAFCPPIEYFALIAEGMSSREGKLVPAVFYVEACENYQKQSYRNRCHYYSSNGLDILNVPIQHTKAALNGFLAERAFCCTTPGINQVISDIRVDYSNSWLPKVKRTVSSAYYSSAFFEYYVDDFFAILDNKYERLFELNATLIRFFLKKLGIEAQMKYTTEFRSSDFYLSEQAELSAKCDFPEREAMIKDYRETIHPKKHNDILKRLGLEKPYFQVFAAKYGFIPNLSIMDLLFNEGPNSISYLKSF